MITIRTTGKASPSREDYQRSMATTLARFFPDFNYHASDLPYLVTAADNLYTIDSHNDWWMRVDEDDSRLIHIMYREASSDPEMERAFATWVAKRMRWEIVTKQDNGV